MHLPDKQPESLTDVAARLSGLTQELLKGLPSAADNVHLPPSADLFADQEQTRLFLVVEGQVQCRARGKLVYIVEPGDLIGLPRSLKLPCGTFSCTEPVVLQPYERDALVEHVNNDPQLQRHWAYYLLCHISFFQEALAQEIRSEYQPSAGFMHFRSGEVIIHQGADADRVYTLLEGTADAVRDGVKVGEIRPSEIFGALAVFTRQKRMASVVASSDCTVLTVRKEEFVDLIDHQPRLCLTLIEEMAAKINELNNQLLNLSH